MKLLMCCNCGDIFDLRRHEKICSCGQVGGRYTDEVNAEYFGDAQLIGFGNGSFRVAMMTQQLLDEDLKKSSNSCCEGVHFTSFMIPANAKSVTKIEHEHNTGI